MLESKVSLKKPAGKKPGLSVLIADDDRFVRQIARVILEDAGFDKFHEAKSGEECINLLREYAFDLAILDINMPPIDGLTLSRYIRKSQLTSTHETAIVIMTAFADRETILRAKAAQIDQLCLKPLSPDALLRRVSAALNARNT